MTPHELTRLRYGILELELAIRPAGRTLEQRLASCLHAAAVFSYVADTLERRYRSPWAAL